MTRTVLTIRSLGLVWALAAVAACSSGPASDASGQPASSMSPLSESASEQPVEPGSSAATDAASSADDSGGTVSRIDEDVDEKVDESGIIPEGFTTVMVEVTEADGTVCELCMWLADSAVERGRGLMGVTSLGTPEGMAFVWEQPTAGAFFMFQTVTPLSIAWFGAGAGAGAGDADGSGALVSTADMEPCLSENSADCERFAAGAEYVLAVEVFRGDLESIGITDGATARLLPATEATDCPLR